MSTRPDELADRVMAERVEGPFANLPVALVTSVVNATLLAYVLWGTYDHSRIIGWLVAIWAVTLARVALLRAYKHRSQTSSARSWGRRFCIGAAANGVAFGAVAVVLFPGDDIVQQVFMAFVLGGMAAGATASSSTYFSAFLAFEIPALTPMIVRVMHAGDRVHLVIGVMLALFGVAMAQLARTGGQRLLDSIRLRFRNETLLRELEAATASLTELNRDLEARVAERTDDLSRANSVKDEFLAVVSHELRTPLTAVIGWAQMMRMTELPPAKREHALEIIERNALAQAKMIEDLLDLSRVTSANPHVELVPFDPAALVEAAVDAIRPAMDAKGVQLFADIDRTSPRAIRGDSARVQQIVGNLLSNAAKFTPQGGRVVIAMHYSERCLEIDVSDTGEGMAPEFIPVAFDRFRQAHTNGGPPRSGLGLGLAISRQLAQLHGGTLDAHSEGLGRGSTFTLRLPLASAQTSAVVAETNVPARPNDLAGVDVLLVDDDPDTREVVGTMIEMAGAHAIVAVDTDDALAALRRQRPSVIVSDLDMPGAGGDGFALIRAVRVLSPEDGGQIPAIALTAHASPANRTRALGAGFQDYVTKPVVPDQLMQRIATLTRAER